MLLAAGAVTDALLHNLDFSSQENSRNALTRTRQMPFPEQECKRNVLSLMIASVRSLESVAIFVCLAEMLETVYTFNC